MNATGFIVNRKQIFKAAGIITYFRPPKNRKEMLKRRRRSLKKFNLREEKIDRQAIVEMIYGHCSSPSAILRICSV